MKKFILISLLCATLSSCSDDGAALERPYIISQKQEPASEEPMNLSE